jgi:SAM-dependent methyltransferase
MLQDHQDAFGHTMHDFLTDRAGYEIIERDDGFFSTSAGPRHYFLEYGDWPACEQQAMEYVRGRVLDVGCGAGRHALYLQEQGFEVLGVDVSPLAIQVCQARGLRQAQVLSITQLSRRLGRFDTLLMLGNNFCLVGTPKRARWLLRRFYHMTPPDGRIVAGTRDPYQTDLPEHLAYHQRNRERGKMSGAARIRVRYKRFVSPWIDFLMLSKEELQTLLEGTRWGVREFLEGPQGIYVAVIEKD